ncbi:hypothetical protein ETAA8_53350 [Anatilimnocola aggregata]|uniref:Uncharacterized protein n=1 Tax=Anatilimnocola aggregata TaxID=2528021 RepID=A0A517YJ13_9BACT|nr:hypothetical protein [Anatilimnocola aggregata]QDU30216.1 hypothetical protein ETAA8_53350 [Anatilimnocola aggregata]
MPSLHAELLEQLAAAGDSLVRAVVQLRSPGSTKKGADDVSALAKEVLARVAETVGHDAKRTNVLKNVGSVIIESDADFLREMIKQPEVISALPSQISQDLMIRPVNKKPL